MNSLSWLIYIAGVLPSLVVFFSLVGVVFAAYGIARLVFYFVKKADQRYETGDELEQLKENSKQDIKSTKLGFLTAFIMSVLVVFTPSEKTFYMIAASEVAGSVATSDMGKEILTELQETISIKLKQFKEGEKTSTVKVSNSHPEKEAKVIEETQNFLSEVINDSNIGLEEKMKAAKELVDLAERAKEILK